MIVFERLHNALERISRYAVWLGGAALLVSAIIVTVDVLARKFLSVTMSGSDEISGYVFAAATTWAYSYCVIHRANVRIDALYNLLPRLARAWLDVLGLFLLFVYMCFLTPTAYEVLETSWLRNSVSVTTLLTPLWIPQAFWFAGLVLFNITLFVVLLYALVSLLIGDPGRVQAIAGTLSVQEEIQEETRGMDVARRSDNDQSSGRSS
ncbi:MAG: TRAP transporter small permease subunit [Hyphomicrobiaceae bacterium]